ncbi:MAG: alpha/beta hydrolase [Pseudomonadota bacterium]
MSPDNRLRHALQDIDVLVLPGWRNSGPTHWQSRWEARFPPWRRLQQENWTHPRRDDWVGTLETAVTTSRRPLLLVAHSLGCITVAHWASRHAGGRVAAALLVAPADVERHDVAGRLRGFAPIPRMPLPFPTLVVGSDNDPACRAPRAAALAHAWGADFLLLQGAGHINADSGLGDWEPGLQVLDTWLGRQALPASAARRALRVA